MVDQVLLVASALLFELGLGVELQRVVGVVEQDGALLGRFDRLAINVNEISAQTYQTHLTTHGVPLQRSRWITEQLIFLQLLY